MAPKRWFTIHITRESMWESKKKTSTVVAHVEKKKLQGPWMSTWIRGFLVPKLIDPFTSRLKSGKSSQTNLQFPFLASSREFFQGDIQIQTFFHTTNLPQAKFGAFQDGRSANRVLPVNRGRRTETQFVSQ